MITLDIVPHDRLDPAPRAEVLALCSAAYEEDFTPHLSRLTGATHLLAREGTRLVAHAAWLPRCLRLGTEGRPLRAAYVEAVATAPDRQRQGIGSQVLRALPPGLADFDLGALSPSEPDFYARAGWELWRGRLFGRRGAERIAFDDEQVMILRLPRTPQGLDLGDELEADWREGDVW